MTDWDVIRWWEVRRLAYNGVLFAIGILSVMGMQLLIAKVAPIDPGGMGAFGLAAGVVIYAVLANLCYTLGWVVELVQRRSNTSMARGQGRKLFILGMWLSCLLTSAPIWFGIVVRLTHWNL